eukprot:8044236-Alexandrium_andersonii.AAC.1
MERCLGTEMPAALAETLHAQWATLSRRTQQLAFPAPADLPDRPQWTRCHPTVGLTGVSLG